MADIYQYDKKSEQAMIDTDSGKRHKERYIENLREGDIVNDFFAVKIKKPQRTYRRGVFFEFIGTDKTGEISIKYWGGDNKDRIKRLYDSFSVGDVVQIRQGNVEIYDERPQISINEKRKRLIQAIEHLQRYGYSVTYDRAYRWLSFHDKKRNSTNFK